MTSQTDVGNGGSAALRFLTNEDHRLLTEHNTLDSIAET
jgi:hypothetical protein